MKHCIVVLHYEGLDDTRKCLASLAPSASAETTVLVVDNASRHHPAAPLADEFPWAVVVRSPVNGGWAGGNNVGIRWALERGAQLVTLLNNDTVVVPNFVERLTAAAVAYPEYGILGPVIRSMEPPHEIMTDGVVFNRAAEDGFFQRKVVPLVDAPVAPVSDVDIVNGCCMIVRAALLARIGLIDERFFLIHEESDFCLRARRAGWRCGVLGEALLWHKGSTSFKRTGKGLQRYYDTRNLFLLLNKHGGRRQGRGRLHSLAAWLRYSYHRYCHEREAGQDVAANAVLEGVCDAFAQRFGPFAPRFRPLVPWWRRLFETGRSLTSGRGKEVGHAPAVR